MDNMANNRVLILSNLEVENYLVQNLSNYTAQQIIAYPDDIKNTQSKAIYESFSDVGES